MLTVVTNTRYERPELLERCELSVAAALPPGASHKIIPIMSDFQKNRFESFLIDEYIAIVDDDDTIHPDSIKLCMEALKTSGADLAFTDEVIVDLNLKPLHNHPVGLKSYAGIAIHPREVHALKVFRNTEKHRKALKIAEQHGIGIEWILTAALASTGGAIRVPINGYFWTDHENQRTKEFQQKYMDTFQSIRNSINHNYKMPLGNIPDFVIPPNSTK